MLFRSADYIIDLGPDGGDAGGKLIAFGSPEEVAAIEGSYTGEYLKKVLPKTSIGKTRRKEHTTPVQLPIRPFEETKTQEKAGGRKLKIVDDDTSEEAIQTFISELEAQEEKHQE